MQEQSELKGTRRLTESTRDIAKAVIVDRESTVDVASQYGVTKQRVSGIVGRYYQAYLTMNLAEDDLQALWLSHGFEMPNTLVKPLERFLKKAHSSEDPKKVQSAVAAVIKALDAQSGKLE